ncbi:MAG TPA: CocE/NonD family hydrolase [Chthoniobacterales bacterium]|jgi:acetyl esterase/lipase
MQKLSSIYLLELAFSVFGAIFFSPTVQCYAALQPPPSEVYATADDGTPLHWYVYTPTGNGPWPAVLVIHGGGFKGGTPISSPESVVCGNDLAAAGYIAFSIEYRLAPNGGLEGQVSDGRFPDQTNDVKLAVLAARSDSRCNGQVGSVGGSAGGYHTAFAAGTGTIGQDRLDVGVSLSGAYDLSDFSPDWNINAFTKFVTNYIGGDSSDTAALQGASPAYVMDSYVAPLFLINTEGDPMPFSQLGDMTAALDAMGVTNYQALTLSGSLHSFSYWPEIKDQALAFLAAGFARPLPTPTATPSPTPSATPSPSPQSSPTQMLVNVSTRTRVESGTSVMIGGFIITGETPKQVVLRALGPSLAASGLTSVLADPVLELYDSTGKLVAQNDNSSSLPANTIPVDLKPSDGLESCIVATLSPGAYTAVISGATGTSGIGLFELYDLDPASARIGNISTRGEVGTTSDVMIGGFIIGGDLPTKVIARALGPSLVQSGVSNALPDPVLELYNSEGSLVFSNDDWRTAQETQINATGIPPTNDREAAIVATLSPGGYTALVHDANGASGIALVEVYNLED